MKHILCLCEKVKKYMEIIFDQIYEDNFEYKQNSKLHHHIGKF